MPQIETLARQAWQLREQGHAIDDIADMMGKPSSAIERWIARWPRIAEEVVPLWHEGLNLRTVQCLEKAGITSRKTLVDEWETGGIERGKPSGINVSRLVEIKHWLEASGTQITEAPSRAMIVDLSLEAEAALRHLKRMSGQNASQVISRLLIEADELARNG